MTEQKNYLIYCLIGELVVAETLWLADYDFIDSEKVTNKKENALRFTEAKARDVASKLNSINKKRSWHCIADA